jgi:hypothetical protein
VPSGHGNYLGTVESGPMHPEKVRLVMECLEQFLSATIAA